ncbi:MAG: nitronate monooxygenase [Bacteroidetes bacterium]|nr:nitronate monooxygenase [Bacteroidota bacterium]
MRPDFSTNRICQLLGITYPIIQAGMIWASGWRLASAVSNAGGLGILGAGSMYPDVLREHIQKCKQATDKPFAVNLPLLYVDIEKHIEIILENQVPIVFTSAGSPRTWTPMLKEKGIKVIHVVSSAAFAQKAEAAGCDAVVAEGYEAGGHNGREQTTTMVLIPQVTRAVSIPVIAAGGIATGEQLLAAMALGACGVQLGTRFVASEESSAHPDFKKIVIQSNEGDTQLVMHKLVPVRLLKNDFYRRIEEAESRGASAEELKEILGRARAKRGMFEGDLQEGELEIGQAASLLDDILPAATIVQNLLRDYARRLAELSSED